MKTFAICLCLFICVSLAQEANAGASKTLSFRLTRQKIASIEPNSNITRQSFEEGWGQFEVHIPKALFLIPAPNCRKNVFLRMVGADPDKPGNHDQLAFRWQLFQAIHAVARHELDHVDVAIKIGPAAYQRINRHGQRELEYCNAFIPGK